MVEVRDSLSREGCTAQASVRAIGALAAALLTLCDPYGSAVSARPSSASRAVTTADVVPHEYIVVFGSGISRIPASGGPYGSLDAVRIAVRQSRDAEGAAKAAGGTIVYRFRGALIGFIAHLPDPALERTKRMPGIWRIDRSQKYVVDGREGRQPEPPPRPRASATTLSVAAPLMASGGSPGAQLSLGLDRIDQRVGTDGKFNIDQTSYKVHVYVIDSGLSAPSAQFGGRVRKGKSVVPNEPKLKDCSGHGTHVAGIIGSKDYGVANQVRIHPVRVVACDGTVTTATMEQGVDWVYTRYLKRKKPFPSVANMSLEADLAPTLDQAIANSIGVGITYVVAAGNSGSDACAVSPAQAPGAITVGSVDPLDDTIASSSNVGSCVDIFAPGVGILSVGIGGTNETQDSGTSMAAPHVTGVAALYLQTHTGAKPPAVWAAILAEADVVPNSYGWNGIQGLDSTTPNRVLYWGPKTGP
ncbi:MAG: aqualysin 1 [Sphingomonadales bacterium]|jgi:subtilisin family serine protease|nr:aqualysin 1 [Sphingomonadales bacterium]